MSEEIDRKIQGVLDQLHAEVRGLADSLERLERRIAAIEAVMPKSMTVEELYRKKPGG